MIKILETPRDAMQGIRTSIPTHKKIEYINTLLQVGFNTVDVGSFVSPKAIPQMADTAEVLAGLDLEKAKSQIMVTIANVRGAKMAMEYDFIDEISFPYSVSEEFLKRNINADKAKALGIVEELLDLCAQHNKELVLYNSMAFGNAYGEEWSPDIVVEDMYQLEKMGVKTIILSDTVDLGEPLNIYKTCRAAINAFPKLEIGAHLHTTPKDWFENLDGAFKAGIRRFDAVINGLGGCPMSGKALVGNLSTANLVEYIEHQRIPLNLDKDKFNKALFLASTIMG
jgi:hydroxymethylglutaryl-CoA lyase